MAFNVENGSGLTLDIDDLGITLEIGEITDLALRADPQTIAISLEPGEEIHALITSGDLIIKDPLLGTDLSVADGIACARSHNDPHYRVGAGARLPDISDINLTSLATDEVLQYNGTDWVNVTAPEIGGSGSFQLEWKFQTSILATDPGSKNFRFNNATPASVTELYVNDISDSGVDASTLLGALQSGDKIYIQQNDDALAAYLFTVTAVPTDNVGWWTVSVSVDSVVALIPGNNKRCAWILMYIQGGGGGGDPDQNLWETITSDSGSAVANTITDTLTIAGGTGISTAVVGDTLTITNDSPNVDQNLWETITSDSGSAVANTTTDTLTITGGPGITTSVVGDTLTISSGAAQVFEDTREPTGFVNRTDSEFTFTVGTRTFTLDVLAPATDYSYYIHGVKYTISTTKTVIIPDTTGLYYFYMDDTETLQFSTTEDYNVLLAENAYIANAYWNAAPATGTDDLVALGEERHGITMDAETHIHLHQSFGAQYINGFGLTNVVTEPGVPIDTDVQFTVASGELRDEDLRHEIIDDGAIPANVFDLIQDLQPTAQIPIWFRTGAAGDWNKAPATSFPFIYSDGVVFTGGVNGLLPWNEFTGATWQLTESVDNGFVLMHYFATNDILNPVIAIQGITNYNNKPAGREQAQIEINQLGGLPFEEFTPIASVIVQARAVYTNTPQARFRLTDDGFNYIDWRDTDLFGGGGGGGSTQNLWETITSDSGSAVANTPNDTLTIAGGTGISTAVVGDTLTITNGSPNVDQNLWETVASDSGSAVANTITDTLTIAGGTGISTAVVGDVLTITNGSPNVDQNLWETITADAGSTAAAGTTETLTIAGGTGITTSIVGNVLTINAGGGGGSSLIFQDEGSPVANTPHTTANFVGIGVTVADGGAGVATITIPGGAGAHDLNFHSDVTITAPADTQKLQYNGSQWVNVEDVVPAPPGGSKIIQLKWSPIPPLVSTAILPITSLVPLGIAGAEVWSDTIDIQDILSTVRISTSVTFATSNASMEMVFVIFRDAVAVGAAVGSAANKDTGSIMTFIIYDVPGAIGNTTYSLRVGKNGGPGTWYINTLPVPATPLGGLLEQGAYTIEEIGEIL